MASPNSREPSLSYTDTTWATNYFDFDAASDESTGLTEGSTQTSDLFSDSLNDFNPFGDFAQNPGHEAVGFASEVRGDTQTRLSIREMNMQMGDQLENTGNEEGNYGECCSFDDEYAVLQDRYIGKKDFQPWSHFDSFLSCDNDSGSINLADQHFETPFSSVPGNVDPQLFDTAYSTTGANRLAINWDKETHMSHNSDYCHTSTEKELKPSRLTVQSQSSQIVTSGNNSDQLR